DPLQIVGRVDHGELVDADRGRLVQAPYPVADGTMARHRLRQRGVLRHRKPMSFGQSHPESVGAEHVHTVRVADPRFRADVEAAARAGLLAAPPHPSGAPVPQLSPSARASLALPGRVWKYPLPSPGSVRPRKPLHATIPKDPERTFATVRHG